MQWFCISLEYVLFCFIWFESKAPSFKNVNGGNIPWKGIIKV